MIGLAAGPILFLLTFLTPVGGLNFEARVVLSTTLWMGVWWVTEAVPIYLTSLLPLITYPVFNVESLAQLSASYADRIVFLLLGGFLIAIAIENSRLHERFAMYLIKSFGSSPKSIVGGFIFATGALSAWISNTAATLVMLPTATSIVSQVKDKSQQARLGNCLMLSVAYAASLGGIATLIGTAPNAVFASLAASLLNRKVSFTDWMLVGVPVSAVSLMITWLYMSNVRLRLHGESVLWGKSIAEERLRQLGPMTRQERWVLAVFGMTALSWVSRGLMWGRFLPLIDDSTIALAGALGLFVIPPDNGKKIIDWDSTARMPWGVLLLVGGGLALANSFTITGLDKWIASFLIPATVRNELLVLLLIAGFTILFGEIMSNTAGAALIIPICAELALSLGMNPMMIMLAAALATSYSFALPVGTPPNAIVMGSGYVTSREMAKTGFPLDLLGILIVSVMSLLLVPIVWS